MKKRLLSIVLAFVMVFSLLPTTTSAAGPVGARSEYNSSTGDVFLGGNYIEVGISKHGSFGTATDPGAGWHVDTEECSRETVGGLGLRSDGDGWDMGNLPVNGDFFLPGSPEERWMLAYKIDGTMCEFGGADRVKSGGAIGDWSVEPIVRDASNIATGELKAVVTGTTTHGVQITITYSFGVDDKFYSTKVDIVNGSGKTLTDVRFLRSFDPDQDQQTQGTYYTKNKVVCNPVSSKPGGPDNFAMVVARGDVTNGGFFFLAFDNRARASILTGLSPSSPYDSNLWDSAPVTGKTFADEESVELSSGGYESRDVGIAVTFNLGEKTAGATDSLEFLSSLDPDVGAALKAILNLGVNYKDEKLTGFSEEEATYSIAFSDGTIWSITVRLIDGVYWYTLTDPENNPVAEGNIAQGVSLQESWLGKSLTLTRTDVESDSVEVTIAPRPEANDPIAPGSSDSIYNKPVDVAASSITTDVNSITIKDTNTPHQEYSIDNGVTWITPDSSGNVVFSGLVENTTYTVKTRIPATSSTPASAPTAGVDVTTIGLIKVTIPAVTTVTYDGTAHTAEFVTVITPGEGAEVLYASAAEQEYTLTEPPQYTNGGDHTYYFRITAEGYRPYYGSAILRINKISQEAPAPEELTVEGETVKNKGDGTISGVNDAMEYSVNGGMTWIPVTGTTVTDLPAGVCYVRYAETENYLASDYIVVSIPVSEETLTVTFDLNGAEGSYGDITGVSFGSTIVYPGTPTRAGYQFRGWYKTASGSGKWNFGSDTVKDNVTIYAKWTPIVGIVSGYVKDSAGIAVSGAVVALVQNGVTISATYAGADGSYAFGDIPAGDYNVVATKDGATTTVLVKVSGDTAVQTIVTPDGDKSSVVDNTAAGSFKANVGGLNEVAAGYEFGTGETSVEIKLTVKELAESDFTDENAEDKAAIENEASTRELEFVDLTLTKKVDNTIETDIGDENTCLLTIMIPFETYNRNNFVAYRYHDGTVQTLTTTANSNGERIVPGVDMITIYAMKFSTYAIGYTEDENSGGPSSDSDIFVPFYSVTGPVTENGKVTLSSKHPVAGSSVTITVTPDKGYGLAGLVVTDSTGRLIELTDNGDGTYSFRMPFENVVVQAAFYEIVCPRDNTCPLGAFGDVKATAWYHDGVHYCIDNGLMDGMTTTQFAPGGTTTRAQIVTILWRLEGQPVADYAMRFADVAAGKWYTEAVRWAAANGIVDGYGDTVFAPNDPITREQMASILWRYCRYKGIDVSVGEDTNILSYSDAFDVHTWAMPAMQWACGAGVVGGIADGSDMKLDPTGSATRAQAATMLQRFCEEIMAN